MALHHGTQPGPGEQGLSSTGLLAAAGLDLPQFPCAFFLENRRRQAARPP